MNKLKTNKMVSNTIIVVNSEKCGHYPLKQSLSTLAEDERCISLELIMVISFEEKSTLFVSSVI